MAQAYITVNEKTYVKHDLSKTGRPPFNPLPGIYLEAPKADIWIENVGKNTFINSSNEELEKFVRRLYRDRNWTTYQVCYCKKQIAEICGDPPVPDIAENEIIEYGKVTFSPKTKKIMKPLPTSRKLFGYMRPAYNYMGLSEYQDIISRHGYEVLLKDYHYQKQQENRKSSNTK